MKSCLSVRELSILIAEANLKSTEQLRGEAQAASDKAMKEMTKEERERGWGIDNARYAIPQYLYGMRILNEHLIFEFDIKNMVSEQIKVIEKVLDEHRIFRFMGDATSPLQIVMAMAISLTLDISEKHKLDDILDKQCIATYIELMLVNSSDIQTKIIDEIKRKERFALDKGLNGMYG